MPQPHNLIIRVLRKIAAILLVLTVFASTASAAQPRVVFATEHAPEQLSAHERHLLQQTDWVSQLRMSLQQSRTVVVLTRDVEDLESILQEKQLADSDFGASDDSSGFRLNIADSILRPVVKRFDVHTTYEAIPLVDNIFERNDTVTVELAVEVIGIDGTVRFTKAVSDRFSYPSTEATLEQKRRGHFRAAGPVRARSDTIVASLVDAIVTRINPITVLDIQAGYFVVDRGAASGLSAGDRMQVFSSPRQIKHPNTGATQRIPGARVAEATITEVHEDVSFATIAQDAEGGELAEVKVGYILRFIGAQE